MMSFLKSILWKNKKLDTSQKNLSLINDLVNMQARVDKLEKEVVTLSSSMQEMTACVQNITLVMHSLSQEVLSIISAINSVASIADARDSDMVTFGLAGDDDDDNLLN